MPAHVWEGAGDRYLTRRPLEVVAAGVPRTPAPLDPSQQARECLAVVVPPVVVVDSQRPAELGAQDQQSLVQQPLGQ